MAWGSFLDGAHTRSNFGQLRLATSGAYPDADQLFAAGFLEGFLTAERIYDNYVNMRDYFTGAAGMAADIRTPMKWWVLRRIHGGGGERVGSFPGVACCCLQQWKRLASWGQAAAARAPCQSRPAQTLSAHPTRLPRLRAAAAGLRSRTAGCAGSAALRQFSRARTRASGRWGQPRLSVAVSGPALDAAPG